MLNCITIAETTWCSGRKKHFRTSWWSRSKWLRTRQDYQLGSACVSFIKKKSIILNIFTSKCIDTDLYVCAFTCTGVSGTNFANIPGREKCAHSSSIWPGSASASWMQMIFQKVKIATQTVVLQMGMEWIKYLFWLIKLSSNWAITTRVCLSCSEGRSALHIISFYTFVNMPLTHMINFFVVPRTTIVS